MVGPRRARLVLFPFGHILRVLGSVHDDACSSGRLYYQPHFCLRPPSEIGRRGLSRCIRHTRAGIGCLLDGKGVEWCLARAKKRTRRGLTSCTGFCTCGMGCIPGGFSWEERRRRRPRSFFWHRYRGSRVTCLLASNTGFSFVFFLHAHERRVWRRPALIHTWFFVKSATTSVGRTAWALLTGLGNRLTSPWAWELVWRAVFLCRNEHACHDRTIASCSLVVGSV